MTEKQYQRKKMSKICSLEAYKYLETWIKKHYPKNPYPMAPEKYFYSVTSHRQYLSKLLEDIIVRLLRAKGSDPVKSYDRGKYIGDKIGVDVIGHKVKLGTIWAKSNHTRPGRADITCFFGGEMLNIEVKIGKDTQSPDQKKEQLRAESNGEKYVIVKTVDDFLSIMSFSKWKSLENSGLDEHLEKW